MGAGVIIARYFWRKTAKGAAKSHPHYGSLWYFMRNPSDHIRCCAGAEDPGPDENPADILPKSTLYFQVYAMGSLGLVLYNNFVGIMQAVGDSRHPLYYLIFSSLLNVTLDMVFVGAMGMGVEGLHLATIIAQFASALFVPVSSHEEEPGGIYGFS